MKSDSKSNEPRIQGLVANTAPVSVYGNDLPLASPAKAVDVARASDLEQGSGTVANVVVEVRAYPAPVSGPAPAPVGKVVRSGSASCCTKKKICIIFPLIVVTTWVALSFAAPCLLKDANISLQEVGNECREEQRHQPCHNEYGYIPGCEVDPSGHVYFPLYSPAPSPIYSAGHMAWYRMGEDWEVLGNCTIDEANTRCISQTDWYENNEYCEIRVLRSGTIHSSHFDTERNFDKFIVDGIEYHGDVGPDNVQISPNSSITWSTDGSVQKMGWRICLTPDDDEPTSNESTSNRNYCSSNICDGGWMHHTVGCGTGDVVDCWNTDDNYMCCYTPPTATDVLDAPWTHCAREGGTCNCPGGEVRYGKNGTWSGTIVGPNTNPGTDDAGGVSCSNHVFGDPLHGVQKDCECLSAAASQGGDEVAPTVFWEVVGDACADAIVDSEPNCLSHTGVYQHNEACTMTALVAGSLDVRIFTTERNYDKINVGGVEYSGNMQHTEVQNLQGTSMDQGQNMWWTSDGSVAYDGWKICLST